jgi:hypothetical protein
LNEDLEKTVRVEETKETYEFAAHVYPNGKYRKLAEEKSRK